LVALAPTSNALHSLRREHVGIAHKIRMALPEPGTGDTGIEHLNHLQKRFGPGRMTFYDVGLGACGGTNYAAQFVVALNSAQFGGYAVYPGPNCFKNIVIEYNGKQVGAQIVDECPTCGFGDLDLSRGLFSQFASEGDGVFYATWWFADGAPQQPPPQPPAPQPQPPAPTTHEQPPPPPNTTSDSQPSTSTSSSLQVAPEQSFVPEPEPEKAVKNLYTLGRLVVQLAGVIGHGDHA